MTTCTSCKEPVPDVELVEGVCSVCQCILNLEKTLNTLGKIKRAPRIDIKSGGGNYSLRVDRVLPPSDRE